jgi:hypothetical protein
MAREETTEFMAMKGAGYYSKATIGAKHVMDNATQMVIDAVDRMDPSKRSGVFRATDMGAADGGTSLDMWRRVLADVRERAPERPIEMIYTDLPRNDFSQVFQKVHGLTGEATYLNEVAGIHAMASATSFHEAILPSDTLDLGFSATASHYITAVPCNIEDHVHMVGATGKTRQAYEDKGAADWDNMLAKRGAEMKRGARLCLFNFGIDSEGQYLGNTGGVNMFDTFALHWRSLVDDGLITEEEFVNTNFPQVYRTQDQFIAPLNDKNSAAYASGLRLEHVESRVVRCPFEQQYSEAGEDPKEFARDYIPTLRSWSEPTFANGLSRERSPVDRAGIIDTFYQRYEEMVANCPEGHAMDYVHIYLVCMKQ